MDTVCINSDGSIDDVSPGNPAALLGCLAKQVALAPGCTLRSFFKMMTRYDGLAHLNAFFPDLLEQFRRGPEKDCQVEGIDRLVLEKTVEMVGFPGEPRLDIYHNFCGRSGEASVPIKDYQVDMLLDMPLHLGKLKHVVFGDQVDVFTFDTVFTLFELIEGIGWELGFHGTPRECQIRR